MALITGSSAKREIQQSGGTLGGEGLAQAGIILGWIGVGLTVVGVCIAGVIFVIPICLLAFGLGSGEWSAIYPLVLAFI